MNDLIGITIISGTSRIVRQSSRQQSFMGKGKIQVRYEMHEHPTFFSIKIFHPDEELPVKVHVGTKAYIQQVWSKKLKL